jgi:hypothetical protein
VNAKTLRGWAERIEKAIGHIDNRAPEHARPVLADLKGEILKAERKLPKKT